MLKNNLINKLDYRVDSAGIDCSVLVTDNHENILYQYNADKIFPSASLIKIIIARYALEYEKRDSTFMDQMILVDPDNIERGAGVIRGLWNHKWKVHDLMYLMLNASDNTATNELIKYFGLHNLSNWTESHYTNVEIKRYMMESSPKDNLINLNEFIRPWRELFDSNSKVSYTIKEALRHSLNKDKLPGLISEIPFSGITYNKTGELSNAEHDIARFVKDDVFLDCAVLTGFKSENERVKCINFIQNVGLIVAKSL
ncbi:serine hydrolase [Companilactobacillus huachuanensis]|uniref:Serine hydrolase n=1 Tax=Companilactobacillus huachuanensis TaxID=2559914 RepID=A0ABW1RNL6_9LACO|nr:serine hydrolase [Companilactobacillus huachuanensis]